MSQLIDFGFVILVLLAFYSKPQFVYSLGQSVYGKVLLLLLVVIMSAKDAMVGAAVALLYFDIVGQVREGLTAGAPNVPSNGLPRKRAATSSSGTASGSTTNGSGSASATTTTLIPGTGSAPSGGPAVTTSLIPGAGATGATGATAAAGATGGTALPSGIPTPSPGMTPAKFRAQYCSLDTNSLVTPTGKYVCMSDVKTTFPYLDFTAGNTVCDPCDVSCSFTIKMPTDLIGVDGTMKGLGASCQVQPVSSTQGKVPDSCYDDMGAIISGCGAPIVYTCPDGKTVSHNPTAAPEPCPCDSAAAASATGSGTGPTGGTSTSSTASVAGSTSS